MQTPKGIKTCSFEMQKDLSCPSQKRLSQCSHKHHEECTLNGNEITVMSSFMENAMGLLEAVADGDLDHL